MLIVRHGRKQYHNFKNSKYIYNGYTLNEVPPLDPDLTRNGRKECYERYIFYCERMGKPPKKIVTSPMIRNRSSALEARKAIYDYFGVFTEIEINTDICEYFSKKYLPLRKEYFNESTWNLIGGETYSRSTDEEINRAINNFIVNREENVWYITHGYFLLLLSKKLEIPISKFNFNEGIILTYDLDKYSFFQEKDEFIDSFCDSN